MALNNADTKVMQPGDVLHDDVVAGLHVRATGKARTFYLYYRTKDGIERRPKLDAWGNITIAQAREAAREMRQQIASGRDPMAERQRAKGAPTVQDVFDDAWDDYWKKNRTAAETKRLFDTLVAPKMGSKRIEDVTFDDVRDLHKAMSATHYQANRVLALVKRLMTLAERPYKVRPFGSNPAVGVVTYPEEKRRRKAEPAEIAKIGPLLAAEVKENAASVAFIYLLMYSGARPSEIAKATWDQLEPVEHEGRTFGVLEVPGKTGQSTIHLPPEAMAVIDKLPRVAGRTITGIQSPKKLWEKVRTKAGCPDLRMRDWRRTFASVALSGGQPLSQVGELLNHRNTQTTKTYAKLFAAPAMDAAASTAATLAGMLSSAPRP